MCLYLKYYCIIISRIIVLFIQVQSSLNLTNQRENERERERREIEENLMLICNNI